MTCMRESRRLPGESVDVGIGTAQGCSKYIRPNQSDYLDHTNRTAMNQSDVTKNRPSCASFAKAYGARRGKNWTSATFHEISTEERAREPARDCRTCGADDARGA